MRLGFQLNNLSSSYAKKVCESAAKWAARNGHTLYVFLGGEYGNANHVGANSIYDRIPPNVDGLVMAAGAIFNSVGQTFFEEREWPWEKVPTVSIGGTVPCIPRVMPDNGAGVSALVEHLVGVHGKGRIAFVAGSKGSADSDERLEGWRRAVESHGLPSDDTLIYPGDFVYASGVDAMRHFMSSPSRPDAIVFANDEMAFGGLDEYRRMKSDSREVPAIVSFDNTLDASFDRYDLSSVDQCYDAMIDASFDLLMRKLRGETVPDLVKVPTVPVYRSSCGCGGLSRVPVVDTDNMDTLSDGIADALLKSIRHNLKGDWRTSFIKEWRAHLAERRNLNGDMLNEALNKAGYAMSQVASGDPVLGLEVSETLREAQSLHFTSLATENTGKYMSSERDFYTLTLASKHITSVQDLVGFKGNTAYWVEQLGIKQCKIILYPHQNGDDESAPARVVLDMVETSKGNYEEYQVPQGKLSYSGCTCGTWLVFPLTMGNTVYGHVLFKYGEANPFVYEFLSAQITSAVSSLKLLDELHNISTRDELTRILNRRGFMELGKQNFQLSIRNGLGGVLFFLDLDWMKDINDTYGHAAGDKALRAAARIIGECIRETDLVGRVGGDEFVIMAVNATCADAEEISDRIRQRFSLYNRQSAKPWTLNVSIGYSAYSPDDGVIFESVLNAADNDLYTAKRLKREEALI